MRHRVAGIAIMREAPYERRAAREAIALRPPEYARPLARGAHVIDAQIERRDAKLRVGLGSNGKPLFARLNGKLMAMGYDQADEQIFGSCSPAPRSRLPP